MKKLLVLFLVLDFIFVGVIVKIFPQKERSIASLQNRTELTEGQNQKLELIKSLKFSVSPEEILINTNMMQSLCSSYSLIQLKFKALNVAFSGQEPLIIHTFSCAEILKNTEQETLQTAINDIKSLHKTPLLKKTTSWLQAHGIYSDEEMPNEWRLFEIAISGETSFNISEAELNNVLGEEVFKFNLTIY